MCGVFIPEMVVAGPIGKMSACRTQTPGNYPKENILHLILIFVIYWITEHFCIGKDLSILPQCCGR
jgi:hypothetical protein